MSNELVLTERTQNGIVTFAKDYILSNNVILSDNFNVGQAMSNLYLNLLQVEDKNGVPALQSCSPVSIQEAIIQCINKELDIGKTQGYFIPRGGKLCFDSSYFGKIKQAKDLAGVVIKSQVVRKGDAIEAFTREDASMIINHKPNVESIINNEPIVGAFAVAYDIENNRVDNSDFMSVSEMNKSIAKSASGGKTTKEVPHEMYRRTVSARLAKHYINTSDNARKVIIKDVDGSEISVNQSSDLYSVDTNYEIDADKGPEVFVPNEDSYVVSNVKMSLDNIENPIPVDVPEGAIEIAYSEYKNNKDKYTMVKDSYNSSTKTCLVTVSE